MGPTGWAKQSRPTNPAQNITLNIIIKLIIIVKFKIIIIK